MEARPLSDLIAALRKGDGNGCRHANALMQEAADALMANQGAIVNSIIERTRHEVPAPQGEPSSIPFYDEKMRELAEIGAQGEPSDALDLVIHAERVGTERDDPLILELAEALRAALRAAGGAR